MWVLFIILAAIFNSVMDRLEEGRFTNSVFKKLNQKFWYKWESWKHAKRIFGFPIDAWHIFKLLMLCSFSAAIVTYDLWPRIQIEWWFDVLLFAAAWILPFNLFYNTILKSSPNTK